MTQNENPEFEDVIREAIISNIMDLRVAMPVRVEKYNKDRQEVDVQPLIKKKYRLNDEIASLPIIPSVPVNFQSSDNGNAYIALPIKVGDLGYVIVCDRSIDKWLSGEGQEVLPEDIRIHNMTDAIFVPGLRPFQNALSGVSDDNIIIVNNDSKTTLKPNGDIDLEGGDSKISMQKSGEIGIDGGSLKIVIDPSGKISITGATQELITVLSGLIQNIINLQVDVTNVQTGSSTIVASLNAASAVLLTADKAKLDTLKI
ncbi:hypothetical protein KAR91_51040 [Candidatus Pacearchaeota archaeon]|nr:hypothetical protein [Candidatus Pacearchaeota archaeon]